jgi:hypothetical protein
MYVHLRTRSCRRILGPRRFRPRICRFLTLSPERRLFVIDQEAVMALARVVSFEGIDKDRMDEIKREMDEGDRPEGVPATEVVVLHDAGADKSLVVFFFDSEDDYATGDATLNAMPAGDTPGRRTSVTKYDVVTRMTM